PDATVTRAFPPAIVPSLDQYERRKSTPGPPRASAATTPRRRAPRWFLAGATSGGGGGIGARLIGGRVMPGVGRGGVDLRSEVTTSSLSSRLARMLSTSRLASS